MERQQALLEIKGKFMIYSTVWKQKYMDRLIKYGGLTKKQAEANCQAIGEIDYTINPESAADDEIDYGKGN